MLKRHFGELPAVFDPFGCKLVEMGDAPRHVHVAVYWRDPYSASRLCCLSDGKLLVQLLINRNLRGGETLLFTSGVCQTLTRLPPFPLQFLVWASSLLLLLNH